MSNVEICVLPYTKSQVSRSRKPNRIDRWQRMAHILPVVALVFRHPHATRSGSHHQFSARFIDRQPMPEYQIIGMFLRQAFFQALETLAAVPRARDNQRAVHWDTFFILDAGHKPRRIGIRRVDDDAKTER